MRATSKARLAAAARGLVGVACACWGVAGCAATVGGADGGDGATQAGPEGVRCGTVACRVGEFCCVGGGTSREYRCGSLDAGMICGGASLQLNCDDAQDCPSGQVCLFTGAATYSYTSCRPRPSPSFSDEYCTRDASCPPSAPTCTPMDTSVAPEFRVGVCR